MDHACGFYEVRTNAGRLYVSANSTEKALDKAVEIINRNETVCANWEILPGQEPRKIDSLIRAESVTPASWLMVHEGRTEPIGELREGVAA